MHLLRFRGAVLGDAGKRYNGRVAVGACSTRVATGGIRTHSRDSLEQERLDNG